MAKVSITSLVLALTIATAPAIAATVNPDTSSVSYRQGSMDRDAWESWYSRLTGSRLAGASYWANNRSHNPLPCGERANVTDVWLAGCMEAQRRLSSSDYFRGTDPQYWNGWNKKVAFVPGIPGEQEPAQTPATSLAPAEIPPAYTPAPLSYCNDSDVTAALPRMIENIQLPLGGGTIKVLKLYNYRRSPDGASPCRANLIADRGLFAVNYGRRILEGEAFVYVNLIRTGEISYVDR